MTDIVTVFFLHLAVWNSLKRVVRINLRNNMARACIHFLLVISNFVGAKVHFKN